MPPGIVVAVAQQLSFAPEPQVAGSPSQLKNWRGASEAAPSRSGGHDAIGIAALLLHNPSAAEHVKPAGQPVDSVHAISQSTKVLVYEHATLAAMTIPNTVPITMIHSR
jgi:hypothetical protein